MSSARVESMSSRRRRSCSALVAGRDRQVKERQVVARRRRLQRHVVGDYRRHVHLQLAGTVPVEQILQTVIEVRHHDEHAHALAAVLDAPLHLLRRGDGGKLAAQPRQIHLFALHGAEGDAHEEALRDRVVELVHLHEVQAPRGEKARDGCGRAHAARATGAQHVRMIGGKGHDSGAPQGDSRPAASLTARRSSAPTQMGPRPSRTRHGGRSRPPPTDFSRARIPEWRHRSPRARRPKQGRRRRPPAPRVPPSD